MGTTFFSLISLFASCFILMMGNGLINVLLPVKMELARLSTDTIGLVLSLYYVGMLVGAVYSKYLIQRAGHVRVFAGCVALGAVSILLCSFDTDPILWGAMRIVIGFCNACAYTAMESWLSDSSTKESRGKVLAAYNAVVLSGLFVGQFLLNVAAPADSTLFVLGGILLCLAVIPIALSKHSGPVIEDVTPMSISTLLKISPLGVVCCVAGGLIYAALFNMLPVFAKTYGIVDLQLTYYMGAAIFGAFIFQFPVGYLSDKYDRRSVICVLLLISAGVGVIATIVAPFQLEWPLFVATALTTGIIACLYPLSISEAFDKLKQNEMVAAMGSMILGFAIGGVLGPYSASLVMGVFGNNSLFYFLAVVQLLLAGFVMYRMSVSKALPIEQQESFVMQGAAIAALVDLDPRTEYVPVVQQLSQEAQTAISIAETDQGAAVNMARAIAVNQPERAVEMASALASVPGIDVLRLYEVMQQALPYRIMEVTRAIVATKPELAYELIQKLATSHPDRVVSVAAEIGHAHPELRVDMAKVAVESAPESAIQVAEYYAQVVLDEREGLRPADEAEDTSEQDVVDIATQIWDAGPDKALDVAVKLAEVVPESAVYLTAELAESIVETDRETPIVTDDSSADVSLETVYQEAIEMDAAMDLLQRMTEAAPESAMDLAEAVVEAVPESAGVIAAELINHLSEDLPSVANVDADAKMARAHQAAINTDVAIDLVQRLSKVAPENTTDVAAAVVEAIPESASLLLDNISAGKESEEGEWVTMLTQAPKEIADLSNT
ncbi:MAG: major facilitator family transporter [Osedax symbiont Rs1]|nr:MAG: major facilitator family transporter [Osedax symbiont Rs1]